MWKRVELNIEELLNARYLKCLPWLRITNRSLKLSDGVQYINDSSSDKDIREVQSILDYSTELKAISDNLQIIKVSRDPLEELIILEGCVRATAFCLTQDNDELIRAILGISPDIVKWQFY